MDSMSRAMHRRKLSSKNAYDGVFSGHRNKAATTVVNVEEYREIFGTGGGSGSSIPVLDLSGLNEANNNNMEMMMMMNKSDYGTIFGGFRDFDVAVTYDEMLARDFKDRAPSSTSQSSQDLDDLSHQSSDALKQFNLSYNKISQRSKDGLDGTTHVTQLHEVPGFTCFIDESASQPKKETKKQKTSVSSKRDFPDKQTSLNDVESKSKHHKKESSSDDTKFKIFQSDFESPPNKVSSPPAAATTNDEATSKPRKETKKLKSLSDDSTFTIFQADVPSKVSSPPAASTTIREAASKPKKETKKQKSLSDDSTFTIFQADVPSKVSSPPAASTTIHEAASKPKKETKKQTSLSDDSTFTIFEADIPSKASSPPAASTTNHEAASQPKKEPEKQKSLSDDLSFQSFQEDIRSQPSQVSSSPAASTSNNEAAFQPEKQTEKKKTLSDDINYKTYQTDSRSQSSNAPTASTINHEAVSQTNKETEKQKSLSDDMHFQTFQPNIGSQPSKVSSTPAASSTNDEAVSQPKETETQKSLSDDINTNTCQANIKSHPSKVSSSLPATNDEPSLPKKETKKQKSLSDDTFTFQANVGSVPLKVSSPPAALATNDEPPSQPKKETKKQKSLSGDTNFTAFQVDIKSHPSKASSSHETSATDLDNHKEYQLRSNASNTKTTETDAPKEIPPTWFDEELDVNSDAATSSAALRKAIEKAQESIRIAKESVGRKKDGLAYSSKSFKDSLKVKRRVANVSAGEEQQEKDNIIKVRNRHKHVADGEKLFGAKKVINDIYGKIAESAKNIEIPIWSRLASRDNKQVLDSEEVVETKAESIQDSTHEAPKKDIQRPNGFLVESCEKEAGDTEDKIASDKDEVGPSKVDQLVEELNNLTVYQDVEEEKKTTEGSDQSVFEKRLSEEALGLLENEKQEVPKQEDDEKVVSEEVLEDEMELKEYSDIERHKEEDTGDKFYDVREVEMIVNAETKEDCEMKDKEHDSLEETWKKLERFYEPEVYENSSSDYDSAVDGESVHGVSSIVIDTQEACKVDQNNNSSESSQAADDVSTNSEFQVVDEEVKEIFENIFADQTASEDNEDECEAKSDDLSNGGLAEVDFEQNAPEQIDIMSESSSDTIHGMELEVTEKEETVEEETVVSVKEEERPEIEIKMETGTSQEHTVEKEETKRIKEVTAEDRERERNRLAVERAIREARERAFVEARERVERERAAVERANAEVRQRVMADAQEKIAKASSDKTSAQSKLRAERAAVERATAEARKRALEKAMSQKKISEPRIQVTEIKQTSSSDLHISNGTSTESALRSKAKLEKHNRIMERAAKALAEKEKRDLLVLREQAERSRLSENLDAEIKRWSTGKEGNLRALLSTLQYILGADSGWQSVSLTEIITTTAVKKAYRKATLCVHPDKLQQRGASIQQKYICEKVFDLLKAAWNKFNSEER